MWSIRLADHLLNSAHPRQVRLACLALLFDSALTFGEWWVLWRRYPWGEWLVVASSGSLLPFEIIELCNGLHIGRALAFVINLLIVAYLALPKMLPRPRP